MTRKAELRLKDTMDCASYNLADSQLSFVSVTDRKESCRRTSSRYGVMTTCVSNNTRHAGVSCCNNQLQQISIIAPSPADLSPHSPQWEEGLTVRPPASVSAPPPILSIINDQTQWRAAGPAQTGTSSLEEKQETPAAETWRLHRKNLHLNKVPPFPFTPHWWWSWMRVMMKMKMTRSWVDSTDSHDLVILELLLPCIDFTHHSPTAPPRKTQD